jgi:IS30 family transposase
MSYEKIVSRNIETEDKDELESSLSQVISAPKRKRPAKIELAATLRKIRHLLAEGYTNREIIEMLNLEERTFYRYMKRIYAQDQAYFEKQDNESIATEIRLAKERTLKSLRRYDAIAADESLSAAERMEAERWRGDIVIALAKIELEGPRIMYETSRRLYDHQYGQKQEQQQRKNGNIASAFEPSRQWEELQK